MPNLNVLTWNSTGETLAGVAALHNVITHLINNAWIPHVIVIQEAQQVLGGAIYNLLNNVPPALPNIGVNYTRPPMHTPEGNGGTRGYILLVENNVTVNNPLAIANFAIDPGVQQLINNHIMGPANRLNAQQVATNIRSPAVADFTFAGRNVKFLTWHTSRGPGSVLQAATLPGGVQPDSFFFQQFSNQYTNLTNNPVVGGISIIAGDLNITQPGLQNPTGIQLMPTILQNWQGVTNNLDHILAKCPAPAQVNFQNAGNFQANGTHNILVTTITWL